ncbi:MAG TPA: DNA repair protein RadA [Haliangiales bacterium]|nr:DNA repair protein RadA [Haliangiales bacterium]
MPAKAAPRSVFRCQACGHAEPKWLGRCPACGEWNALVEEISAARGAPAREAGRPVPAVDAGRTASPPRLPTGIRELDRVLGGGLVLGSFVLLGGDPGIGKSTLLLQALDGLAAAGRPILYASGEESVAQTGLRAARLGVASRSLLLHAETSLERILAEADRTKPRVLAVDSVQTVYTDAIDSIPGSIAQVRECAGKLMAYAKSTGVPVIVVGHVTKDGMLAGPKTLEHVVDVVLQFEGEGAHDHRILRSAKNRFGATSEIGVFAMRPSGLVEVENPSELFLAERPVGAAGSVVVASADGTRPFLCEVQALVAPPSAGVGRRTTTGVDVSRVSLLLAVLAERAGVDALVRDVFVNVAGGVRLGEPAIDLGIACAVASAQRNVGVSGRTVVFGELGLAGEVRAVPLAAERLQEAVKLGFERAILPRRNRDKLDAKIDLDLVGVDHLRQALGVLLRT